MRDVEKEMCLFLEKKLDKFREYQSVTEKMRQAICGNDEHNKLSGLINKRQRCIAGIERINSSLERIIRDSSKKLTNISKKYKALIDKYLLSIKEIMIQVDLMDKELVTIVAEQGEGLKTELFKIQNMRQANRGYQGMKRYPPKFLDTRR